MNIRRAKRWGSRCATVGFVIAVILSALAFLLNTHHINYNLDAMYIALWPASLGLMAVDRASMVVQILDALVLAVVNALMYFALGFLAGLFPESEGPQ
jgi:hypothetical protein